MSRGACFDRGARRPRLFNRQPASTPDRSEIASLDTEGEEELASAAGSPMISIEDARTSFGKSMEKLETLGRKRRVRNKTYERHYRRANDAYAALSNHLDAHDPEQRAELEEAYRLLKERLGEIKVRKPKRR